MNCPKCDALIAGARATECPSCGVVLEKAMGSTSRRYAPTTPAASPGSATVVSPRLIFAVVMLVIGVTWAVARRGKEESAAARAGWYFGAAGYERAAAEQKNNGAPVLLYFYTDWCGWCKRLDSDVFASPEFQQRYGSMLKVKVNAERKGPDRNLALEYGVGGFPAVYILSTRTSERQLINGYAEPAAYMAQIDRYAR